MAAATVRTTTTSSIARRYSALRPDVVDRRGVARAAAAPAARAAVAVRDAARQRGLGRRRPDDRRRDGGEGDPGLGDRGRRPVAG